MKNGSSESFFRGKKDSSHPNLRALVTRGGRNESQVSSLNSQPLAAHLRISYNPPAARLRIESSVLA